MEEKILILDTCFIFDAFKNKEYAIKKLTKMIENNIKLKVTSVSVAEIISGLSRNEKHKIRANKFFSNLEILDLNLESAYLAGEIDGTLIKLGQQIDFPDCLIAGITITNNETLLTKNIKHFERINNLKIESY